MAGRTARRSGLESAGVVVEMYKNLTDRAGSSCFIGPLTLRLMPNTAPHICGPCYNCLNYPLFQIVLNYCGFEINYQTFPKYSLFSSSIISNGKHSAQPSGIPSRRSTIAFTSSIPSLLCSPSSGIWSTNHIRS